MVGRAALNINNSQRSYVFHNDKYVQYEWTPGSTTDKVVYGPTEFVKEWPSLKQAGFSKIDAILPIPSDGMQKAYFFSGDKYARIEFVPDTNKDKILGPVQSITAAWKSLKEAGFAHVDAAYNVPNKPGEVYFFCGEQYCRVSYTEGNSDNDKLLYGPKPITTGWAPMKLETVDMILPEPKSESNAYFLSGNQYSRIKVVPDGTDELITGPKDVAPYWPGLHKAGFY